MAKKKAQPQRSSKQGRQKAAQKTERTEDLRVVGDVLELVRGVPSGLRGSNQSNHERSSQVLADYKPLKERLDELRARYIPEAVVVSPCGLGDIPYTPWENFLTCPDFCGACRGEAERALALIEEGLVGGKVSGPFMGSALIAERNATKREHLAQMEARRVKRDSAMEIRFEGDLMKIVRLPHGIRGKESKTMPNRQSNDGQWSTSAPQDPSEKTRPSGAPNDLEILAEAREGGEPTPPSLGAGASSISCRGKVYAFPGPLQRQVMQLLFTEWSRGGCLDGGGTMTEDQMHTELDRERVSTSTRPAKLFRNMAEVREILVRVAPATWALFLTGDPPDAPEW